MRPPLEITRKIDPDGAKAAGALLHGWAKRTARAMPSLPRHIRALVNYMPTSSQRVFHALGGNETFNWATEKLAEIGYDDTPDSTTEPGEILVLGLPYGGPRGGKDREGQFFSPMTDFLDGVLDSPPVMYTHGTQNGFEPETIGKVKRRWYDRRGGWFKVALDPQGPRYGQLMTAYENGTLFASTGVVPASYSANEQTGHIDTWLVGELSLVDTRDGYVPVNSYAITKCEIDASALMTDYYGDPVEEVSMMSQARQLLEQLVKLLTSTGEKQTEDTADEEEGMKAEPAIAQPDQEEIQSMVVPENTEKCTACEEAEALAAELRAEIAAEPKKCARCPDAIRWVKAQFKAGKIGADEAYGYIDTFTKSDETFDTVVAAVEAKSEIKGTGMKATTGEQLFIAGGTGSPDASNRIDPDWMNKQRRLAGLQEKK